MALFFVNLAYHKRNINVMSYLSWKIVLLLQKIDQILPNPKMILFIYPTLSMNGADNLDLVRLVMCTMHIGIQEVLRHISCFHTLMLSLGQNKDRDLFPKGL